jgi:hypothetical protein
MGYIGYIRLFTIIGLNIDDVRTCYTGCSKSIVHTRHDFQRFIDKGILVKWDGI